MAQKSLLGKRKLSSLNTKLLSKSPTKAPYTGNLLPCKVQRTYQCQRCDLVTRNPRDYLYHLRDVHGEKLRVYECEHCIYASRHPQKLQRHVGFIHSALLKAKGNGESSVEKPKMMQSPARKTLLDKKIFSGKRPKRPASASPVSVTLKGDDESFSDDYGQNFEVEEFLPRNYPNDTADDEFLEEEKQPQSLNGDTIDPEKVYNELEFKCSVCQFKSKSKVVVQRHEKVIHLKKKLFRCMKCGYATHKRGRYTKHIKYHSLPSIKCESCDFKTPYKWNLDRHVKNHNAEAIHRCKLCSFAANTKQSLTVHVMNHHEGGEKNSFLASIGLVCQSDGASAHQEEKKKKLESDQTFVDVSGEDFPSEFYRRKGRWCRRMLYCKECPFATTSSNELQEHEIQHRQDEMTSPTTTSLSPSGGQLPARQRLNLRARSLLRKVSKDVPADSPRKGTVNKPLKCKHCAYEAKWMSELVKHNRIHTQEKPFSCNFCSFRSRWKGDMTRHVQKYHGDILPEGALGYEVMEEEGGEPLTKKRKLGSPKDEDRNACGQEEEGIKEEKEDDLEGYDNGTDARSDAVDEVNGDEGGSSSGQGSLHVLRKCYRCPHCKFTATTASRFHVHIVAHLNQRPFMCSECGYRSNWQWDVTKHIRLKSSHQESHTTATMVMVNEFAHRDYESYNKYIIYEDNPYSEDRRTTSSRSVLGNTAPDEGGRTRYSVWKCIECAYKCTTKQGILQHLSAHSSDRPFFCGECGQSSKWRSIIESHCHTRHGNLMCIIENKKIVSALKGRLAPEENAYDDTNEQEGFIKEVVSDGNTPVASTSAEEMNATTTSPGKGSIKGEGNKQHCCQMCPYQTRKMFDMRMHMRLHKPQPGAIFKCMFCPFYTSLRRSLLNHMKLHVNEPQEYIFKAMQASNEHLVGDEMDNAIDENEQVEEKHNKSKAENTKIPTQSSVVGEGEAAMFVSVQMKRYSCDHCPYTSNSKTQYLYHKQFHRTSKVGPFKCSHCSYSVTKSHLLLQHIKLHKRAAAANQQQQQQQQQQQKKNLIQTPEPKIKEATTSPTPGTSLLKPLKNQIIMLDDLMKNSSNNKKVSPIWVPKGGPSSRVYKCRFCPHVNKRRSNIREHEKMHRKRKVLGRFSCPHCTYVCNNQGVLSSHVKVHLVDNEAQYTLDAPVAVVAKRMDGPWEAPQKNGVFFCDICPARFPRPSNAEIHRKFHGAPFPWKCTHCTYAARHRPHLHRHLKVHTPEYENRSKELNFDENISDLELPQKKVTKPWDLKKHTCHLCPAAFLKISSLTYHLTLHGGNGKFKCSYCDYAVRNCGNLVRHTKIHESSKTKISNTHGAEKKRLTCTKCPAMFDKYSRYDVHMKLHGSNQRFTCKHCDYSVKFMANLLKHQRMHEENLPNESHLQRLLTPSPEKSSRTLTPKPKWGNGMGKSNCGEMPLELSLSEQQMLLLLQHQQQMVQQQRLGEDAKRLFYCDRCPYQHSRKDAVISHLKRHNGNQEMTCQYCDYSTTMGSFLREHCKLHFQQPKRQKIESFLKWEDMEVWVTNPNGENSLIFKDMGQESQDESRFVTFSDDSQTLNGQRGEEAEDERVMELPLEVIVKTDGEPNGNGYEAKEEKESVEATEEVAEEVQFTQEDKKSEVEMPEEETGVSSAEEEAGVISSAEEEAGVISSAEEETGVISSAEEETGLISSEVVEEMISKNDEEIKVEIETGLEELKQDGEEVKCQEMSTNGADGNEDNECNNGDLDDDEDGLKEIGVVAQVEAVEKEKGDDECDGKGSQEAINNLISVLNEVQNKLDESKAEEEKVEEVVSEKDNGDSNMDVDDIQIELPNSSDCL